MTVETPNLMVEKSAYVPTCYVARKYFTKMLKSHQKFANIYIVWQVTEHI